MIGSWLKHYCMLHKIARLQQKGVVHYVCKVFSQGGLPGCKLACRARPVAEKSIWDPPATARDSLFIHCSAEVGLSVTRIASCQRLHCTSLVTTDRPPTTATTTSEPGGHGRVTFIVSSSLVCATITTPCHQAKDQPVDLVIRSYSISSSLHTRSVLRPSDRRHLFNLYLHHPSFVHTLIDLYDRILFVMLRRQQCSGYQGIGLY